MTSKHGLHGLWPIYVQVREMVKTIVLRQDPPLCKKAGGLFMYMYPPSPTLKDGVLFV